MPKNKGAGGKNRRRGKATPAKAKELVIKLEGEEYAQVIKSVGNGFLDVKCFTNNGPVLKRAHIRGSMRKKVWMGPGDIVLVSTRGFSDKTCDILHKYNTTEAKLLQSRKQLPENIEINQSDPVAAEEDKITFVENETSDDEKSDGEISKKITVPDQNRNFGLPPSDSESEDE